MIRQWRGRSECFWVCDIESTRFQSGSSFTLEQKPDLQLLPSDGEQLPRIIVMHAREACRQWPLTGLAMEPFKELPCFEARLDQIAEALLKVIGNAAPLALPLYTHVCSTLSQASLLLFFLGRQVQRVGNLSASLNVEIKSENTPLWKVCIHSHIYRTSTLYSCINCSCRHAILKQKVAPWPCMQLQDQRNWGDRRFPGFLF